MDITFVFFIYGLAFFTMGIILLLESGRSIQLGDGKSLLPLAIFGLLHGIHEWVEMLLDKSDWLEMEYPTLIAIGRLVILALSFAFLLYFGLITLRFQDYQTKSNRFLIISIFIFVGGIIAVATLISWVSHEDWIKHVDAATRYLLAVPASILAGYAFQNRAKKIKIDQRSTLTLYYWMVAFAFYVYAITQTAVSPSDIFPANIWNSDVFIQLTGFHIQVIRAIIAVAVTICILRAVQFLEKDRQIEFIETQKAKFEALEQIQLELEKRQTLRQEMLKHIVIAQEEERAHISRELHDETSQLLTAMSLHLENLRNFSKSDQNFNNKIDELHNLRREMSDGLHRLMHDLRPPQLDDLGLAAAIRSLVDEIRRTMELDVELIIHGQESRINSLIETVIFRVAQEALTNVARHANVKEAKLIISYFPQRIELRVQDRGVGFILNENLLSTRGWGLAGMRERVDAVYGELQIETSPRNGTKLMIRIPTKSDSLANS